MPYDQVMHKFKHGELKSGSGKKVTDRKQAIAIRMSEKKKAGEGKTEYQSKGEPVAKKDGNWGRDHKFMKGGLVEKGYDQDKGSTIKEGKGKTSKVVPKKKSPVFNGKAGFSTIPVKGKR